MGTTVAEVEHVSKSFGDKAVLQDINLKVERGQNLVIFGKSGSGKSVLIKCLAGLIKPDKGRVMLFGNDLSELNEKELNLLRKKVGFLFQSAALYDSMTVKENLEFPLRDLRGKQKAGIESRVIEALEHVGLVEAIDKMPAELSGGMRKRIGLARTLIQNPEIILYDEPTTGLDPITSREISGLILEVQKKFNATSIIITHDVECARATSNRMIIIQGGSFLADGTFRDLSESTDASIHSFFK